MGKLDIPSPDHHDSDMDDKMEVMVFWNPACKRCQRIHEVILEAKKSVGWFCHFVFMNTGQPHVRLHIAPKYGVWRIPSIVCRGDVYFVGVPDLMDLVSTLSYLYTHPEGGHGLEGG